MMNEPAIWLDIVATSAVVFGALWWLARAVKQPSGCGSCDVKKARPTAAIRKTAAQLSLGRSAL